MTEKQIAKFVKLLVEHQNCFTNLSTEDARWAIQNTPEAIILMVKAISERDNVSDFLKLISGETALILDAVDGQEILANANYVFTGWIDPNFKNCDVDEQCLATGEVAVSVYEMIKDGMYHQIFDSLSKNFDKLCLTQAQIKNFVVKHYDWLRTDGNATFFAFKSKGERLVAYVSFNGIGKLDLSVNEFRRIRVWHAERAHRFVIPQLIEI